MPNRKGRNNPETREISGILGRKIMACHHIRTLG